MLIKVGIEQLLNDEPENMVPPHLRAEGVDTELINEILRYDGGSEAYERLYMGMNPATEDAFNKTVDWHFDIALSEKYSKARLDLQVQLEQVRQRMREILPYGIGGGIDMAYTTYLVKQGLPLKKISWWRKFLLGRDANVAQLSGRNIDQLEPEGFGLYFLAYHLLRRPLRRMMLEGADLGKP